MQDKEIDKEQAEKEILGYFNLSSPAEKRCPISLEVDMSCSTFSWFEPQIVKNVLEELVAKGKIFLIGSGNFAVYSNNLPTKIELNRKLMHIAPTIYRPVSIYPFLD